MGTLLNEPTRKIRVYSNAINISLDYTKEYVFHHWVNKRTALIEMVETGFLLEVEYYGNFNFCAKEN